MIDWERMHIGRARVSVIVPTKDSARTIRACLASARDQHDADVEIIVVDNFSGDGTEVIARELADVFLQAGPERSAQRNLGARRASGEFFVFIDSDMVVEPEIATEAIKLFEADPQLVGLVIPEYSFGAGFWASCRALERKLYIGDDHVEAARIFRKDAFIASGGYDERLTGPEDWDLAERAAGMGKIGRVNAAVLHDEGRLTLREDLKKKFHYGHTLARYAMKHRSSAARRLVRPGFIRRADLLREGPRHAVGLIVMKLLEAVAVLAGLVIGRSKRTAASSDAKP